MKKLLIATAFVLALAPACFSQERTEAESAAARQKYLDSKMIVLEEDAARITTDMNKAQYQGGENFVLHINLKNVGTKYFGNSHIGLGNDKVYNFYNIEVVDQTGAKLARQKIIQLPDLTAIRGWGLRPGQTQKAIVWLNNMFDFPYGGKFKVTVSKTFRKDGQLITITSDPVEFEITTKKLVAEWDRVENGD